MESNLLSFYNRISNKVLVMGMVFAGLFASRIVLDVMNLSSSTEEDDFSESSETESESNSATNERRKSVKSILKKPNIRDLSPLGSVQTSQKNIKTKKDKAQPKENEKVYKRMIEMKKRLAVKDRDKLRIVKICFTGGPCAGEVIFGLDLT